MESQLLLVVGHALGRRAVVSKQRYHCDVLQQQRPVWGTSARWILF